MSSDARCWSRSTLSSLIWWYAASLSTSLPFTSTACVAAASILLARSSFALVWPGLWLLMKKSRSTNTSTSSSKRRSVAKV